jgi:hypothetical protein
MCFGCFSHMFFMKKKQATWQPHKPHKTIQLIKKHMRNWHYKSSSFRGEDCIEEKNHLKMAE